MNDIVEHDSSIKIFTSASDKLQTTSRLHDFTSVQITLSTYLYQIQKIYNKVMKI